MRIPDLPPAPDIRPAPDLRPTPGQLRNWLAGRLEADFALGAGSQFASYFPVPLDGSQPDETAWLNHVVTQIKLPGYWDSDIGDNIPPAFALLAGLPMTVIGLNTYHLGPQDQSPEHYIVYNGSHYQGATTAERVRTWTEVPEASGAVMPQPAPADAQTLERHRDIYREAFDQLLDQFQRRRQQPDLDAREADTVSDAFRQGAEIFFNYAGSGLTQLAVDGLGNTADGLADALRTLTNALPPSADPRRVSLASRAAPAPIPSPRPSPTPQRDLGNGSGEDEYSDHKDAEDKFPDDQFLRR